VRFPDRFDELLREIPGRVTNNWGEHVKMVVVT